MKTTKYTPAPWRMDVDNLNVYANGMIAQTYGHTHNGERAANARLIAAAPAMIEALETALGEFREKECNCDADYVDGREVGYPCYFHRIEQMLREAIAKAEGK